MAKRKPPGYWTKERCATEALKYKTRSEFRNKAGGAYSAAHRNGWLGIICVHMSTRPGKPDGYWAKERCATEALKYKTRSEFSDKAGGAYNASVAQRSLVQ